MKLQEEQIKEIKRHLKVDCWLEHEDFIEEMTDHYACILEEKLDTSIEWTKAIEDIDKSFGKRYGLTTMQDEYGRQQEYSIRGEYMKFFKAYFFNFPNYLLVIALFTTFYILSSNSLINRDILMAFAIFPLLVGLCCMMLSGRHTKTNKDKPFRLLFYSGQMTMSFSTFYISFTNLFRNLMANDLWVSTNSTLMIISTLACLNIIYKTYPKLKRRAIA